jgi:hypothetical protein
MKNPHKTHRERDYGPQQAKGFQQVLTEFILREFPRLGGPWVVKHFVAKIMALLEEHFLLREHLQPGQTVWMAVAADERPGYRKSMRQTRQVPVVLTLVNQEDIAALKQGAAHHQILQEAVARVTYEAYQQGGVLSLVDLGLLFSRSPYAVRRAIRPYEERTQQVLPRRGTVHDLGMTVSHKRLICYKAFVEAKTTPTIALETFHSPEAVDRYLLDFARVFLAVHKRGLSPKDTAFTIGRSLRLVNTYLDLIQEFGLAEPQITARVPVDLFKFTNQDLGENERREKATCRSLAPVSSKG